MPTFEHDGLALAYDDSGQTDLEPVIFLHGMTMSRKNWGRVTPALAGQFRVIALDQRAHGDSSHAPGTYTIETYAADAAAFCEQIVGKPSVLVGHSLGGVVAGIVAQTQPNLVRCAVLEDPPWYRGEPSAEPSGVAAFFPLLRQALRDMQDRSAPIEEYIAMVSAAPALNGAGSMTDVMGEEGTRAMAQAFMHFDPEVLSAAIDGTMLGGINTDAPIDVPVLVLRADPGKGPAFSTEDEARFLRTNPTATVEVVDGASHAIHDEQPERFAKSLLAFLQ